MVAAAGGPEFWVPAYIRKQRGYGLRLVGFRHEG